MSPMILGTGNGLHGSHLCHRGGLSQPAGDDDDNTPSQSSRATIGKNSS